MYVFKGENVFKLETVVLLLNNTSCLEGSKITFQTMCNV